MATVHIKVSAALAILLRWFKWECPFNSYSISMVSPFGHYECEVAVVGITVCISSDLIQLFHIVKRAIRKQWYQLDKIMLDYMHASFSCKSLFPSEGNLNQAQEWQIPPLTIKTTIYRDHYIYQYKYTEWLLQKKMPTIYLINYVTWL